ncbi:hypothetical protein GQ457_08G017620 [Hibiscus cannabinus]
MEKRVLRTKGMASMKYGTSSEYFTIVMHHGGFMVNSPRFQYSGKEVSFFDMCHIDSMSMLEIFDIVEELGYGGKTYTDVIAMLACMPRNKQLHVYLEEDVGESIETVRTVYHVMEDLNPPVRTEEHVRTEEPEPISSDEDSDYVADSGFEDSEDDGSEEEGFAHEVHVQMGSEMDMNNLNNVLLGGCPALAIQQSTKYCKMCWPTHAGGHKYQVSEGPLNQHAVDLENGTCSGRKWDITGIPCIHVVSVMALNNQRPESFVHTCYKSTTQHCEPVIEPNLRRPPGRPKKKMVKEADEAQNSGARWTRKGLTMYCSKCKKTGHNQRTCKGEVRRTTTLSSPPVMPTSSSPPVMPTTSASPQISPFVFIPTPGNGTRVRWMQSSHEDVNGG